MINEDLKSIIIKKILKLEKENIYSGEICNSSEMKYKIEEIIIKEVNQYENRMD